jgi:alpha-galactosidase
MIEILGGDTLFHLATKRTSYILGVFGGRWLAHYYWGSRIEPDPSAMACLRVEPAPYEVADDEDKRVSLNRLPLEYPYGLAGDFRRPAFEAYAEGRAVMDLSVASWRRYAGRPEIPGLPFARARGSKNVETFEVTLADGLTGFEARLSYTVFEEADVIARSVLVSNRGEAPIDLLHASSFSVDLSLEGPGARREELELLSLHGAWARERSIVRQPIRAGRIEVESLRGVSSHCASPNCALVRRSTDEESGDAWGFSLVYSGDWRIGCERSEEGDYRAQGGLNPSTFSWRLGPGEDFACPEALLSYSSEGLGGMSRNFHAFVLDNLLPARWASAPRPILINNWEATYFDFDEKRLLGIAARAAQLGVELFVLDDGWFGRRDDDRSSLGDWRANERKLRGGLGGLADKVRALGLRFGLWIEPEMVSPDSDLYRAHPDWCLHMEGRPRTEGRNQLVLDLTRAEVRDYIVQRVIAVLREARADYAKWDMNRPLSHAGATPDPGASSAPGAPGGTWMPQKELRHRYVLGLYEILDRITSALPDTLFEGCAGGGGRMDMGLLAYMPQYWASDDTDALARLEIQYGTSLFFPPVTIGSHVSAVPNHQTGRSASLRLRGLVAMSANLGYELDPRTFSAEDASAVAALNAWYKAHRELVQHGRFIRLASPFEGEEAAWSFVSEDGERALAFCFRTFARANQGRFRLRLRALKPELLYSVSAESGASRLLRGSELMGRGVDFDPPAGEGGILLELSALDPQ